MFWPHATRQTKNIAGMMGFEGNHVIILDVHEHIRNRLILQLTHTYYRCASIVGMIALHAIAGCDR